MLDEMIHFLNELNREFATGAVDYHWNGYHDNCVHTLRNALAAASIGEPISVWASKLRQIFHLAIPANEAINLAAPATRGPIDSYAASSTTTRPQRAARVRLAPHPPRRRCWCRCPCTRTTRSSTRSRG